MWRPTPDHGDINPGTKHDQTLFMESTKGLPVDQQLDLTRSRRIQPHAIVATAVAKFNNMKVNGDWSKFDSRDTQMLALATKNNELTSFNATTLVTNSNNSSDDLRRMMVSCLQNGEFLELKLPSTKYRIEISSMSTLSSEQHLNEQHWATTTPVN